MIRIICLVIGYAFGLIQSAYLYCKRYGIDIRDYGSGNSGMTNTLRTLGTKAGIFVLLGDLLKTALSILVVTLLFSDRYPDKVYLFKMYAAVGCVIGHNFPFYMKFKGGKGVAVTGGLFLSMHWIMIPFAFASFLIPFLITHYVSLGSMVMAGAFCILLPILGHFGVFAPAGPAVLTEMYVLGFFISAMLIFQHRANIERLKNHNERKTYLGRKNKAAISREERKRMKKETHDRNIGH